MDSKCKLYPAHTILKVEDLAAVTMIELDKERIIDNWKVKFFLRSMVVLSIFLSGIAMASSGFHVIGLGLMGLSCVVVTVIHND